MHKAVQKLVSAQLLQLMAGICTGMISARALGVSGRGELAAVMAPLTIALYVFPLGLTTSATRLVACGASPRAVAYSLGGLSFLLGAVAIPLAFPIGELLAPREPIVRTLIIVGACTMPISLLGSVLTSIATGLEDWSAVSRQRVIATVGPALLYLVLVLVGGFTVVTASVALWASGIGALITLRRTVKLSWPPIRTGVDVSASLAFGLRATPLVMSGLLNQMLDQTIMTPYVDSRQLGLYSAAVSISSLANLVSGAVGVVALPTLVTQDDPMALARLLRATLVVTLVAATALAIGVPLAIVVLYGPAYSGAYPLALVLLIGALPMAGSTVLNASYAASGKVGRASLSEVWALAVTVPGLLILLPLIGAMGASIVSSAAYTVSFAWVISIWRRQHGVPFREALLPRRADFAAIGHRLTARLGRA